MRPPLGPGTYALLLRLYTPQQLQIGALGRCDFPAGWYVYTGSAFGPGGIAARVTRHARAAKCLHWHVDYLLPPAELLGVWGAAGQRVECLWAQRIGSLPTAQICVERFGASDCRCRAHLFYFVHRPAVQSICTGGQWWNRQTFHN